MCSPAGQCACVPASVWVSGTSLASDGRQRRSGVLRVLPRVLVITAFVLRVLLLSWHVWCAAQDGAMLDGPGHIITQEQQSGNVTLFSRSVPVSVSPLSFHTHFVYTSRPHFVGFFPIPVCTCTPLRRHIRSDAHAPTFFCTLSTHTVLIFFSCTVPSYENVEVGGIQPPHKPNVVQPITNIPAHANLPSGSTPEGGGSTAYETVGLKAALPHLSAAKAPPKCTPTQAIAATKTEW